MMKFKELAQLSKDERKSKQSELEMELIKLNTQVATGTPPKNAGTVSRIKKDIARLMLIDSLSAKKSAASAAGAGSRQSSNVSAPKAPKRKAEGKVATK
jgi:ribosomal protein L29